MKAIAYLLALTIYFQPSAVAAHKQNINTYRDNVLTVETMKPWAWDYQVDWDGSGYVRNVNLCTYTFKEITGEYKVIRPFFRACSRPGSEIKVRR